ncbi:hypothetical protein LY90DRAFT_663298 [Neocallimastix californiae]|jgi:ABC-type multidrug transport system fused ATPase/permease subunit|uniref:P-loop containing nucleoside triphosphate hydrolase protein n=1 Tax=Neocallimastix californiae TaxID=1754190 RepID=A0A1Y2FPB5_9FUNG|nr:hypothetical protein LY90DRAFT_663298 [Neocallimastix californiae]|eukprot:ORY85813.1 hypothetical protein LY90DRAFT_663298 [Neocallimastix californiae]
MGKKEYPIPEEPKPSPYTKANILSKITYSWENPLFKVGYHRPLEKNDLYLLPPKLTEAYNEDRFYDKWNKTENKKGKGNANVLKTLVKIFGLKWCSAGVLKLFSDACSTVSPVFLELLLDHLSNKEATEKEAYKGWVYIFCIFGLQIFSTLIVNYYTNLVNEVGLSIRATLIGIIYRKTLKLSNKERQTIGDGQIINLVSSDTGRLQRLTGSLHYLWSAPIQLIAILFLLVRSLGVWSLIGFAIFVLVVPLQGVIMKFLIKYRRQTFILTDQRVKKTQEVIGSMRVIKFFGWEESFLNILQNLRKKEINRSKKGIILHANTHAIFGSIPFVSSAATFIAYSAAGNKLTAAKVFSSLAFFNMLRGPLSILPNTFNQLADASVSLKRLNKLINAKDIEDLPEVDKNSEYAITIKDGQFNWEVVKQDDEDKKKKGKKGKDKNKSNKSNDKKKKSDKDSIDSSDTLINNAPKTTSDITEINLKKKGNEDNKDDKLLESFKLYDINIKIKKNSLTAIVGAVGSGKSSLINAIIGEMKREEGKIVHGGSFSYCSQQAWIQNATVRDNILFGKEYNEERYKRVIDLCALTHDLEIFPDGDMTEIGERGINLSGGQKQRINLARAVYFNSDIILMDDPLSAVDAHVSRALFDNCILGALADKTRVLVTHQLHVLPRVDYIIVMKGGRIEEQGEYNELMQKDGEFSRLMHTYGGIDDSDDNLDSNDSSNEEVMSVETDIEPKEIDVDETVVEKKEEKEEKTKGRALMTKEERATGSVDKRVYKDYLKAAGGIIIGILILIAVVIIQVSKLGNDMWLVFWTEDRFKWATTSYIIVYLIWNVSQILLNVFYSIFMSFNGFRASKRIHRDAISRVIRAPISFFDTTPLGRIINRFSKDQDSLDGMLFMAIQGLINSVATTITTLCFMLYAAPIFGVALIPLLILYYFVQKYYISTSREIKRLESLARSPLFANFTETLQGLPTIRAYSEQERFTRHNQDLVDGNNRPFYLQFIAQRWLGVRLECIGSFLVLFDGIAGLFLKDSLTPSLLGLSLSYALQVTSSLNGVIRSLNEVEINMNSAERLLYYANEIEMEDQKGLDAPKDWPQKGKIEINNLTMKYAPHLPPVLHNINLSINSNEKVGVVGRTGAGKSSIVMTLFRLVEPEEGSSIKIDDVSISSLKLNDLRKNISIIPQDPILFSGTIRFNMDPFDEHTDQEIWEALENAGLKQTISELENKLEAEVRGNGENFSVGQRQLLCLARAMIRNSRILVMDEATASVDIETDAIIQKALRTKFNEVTVLTIAHRLNTIIDYDKILVLSKGEVLEYDTPKNLLFESNENGEVVPSSKTEFSKLVDETGPVNAALLRQLALDKENRIN